MEERRRRVLENRVLRRIFGPRRDEVTREWRKLHNEELNDLYSSLNIVRVIKSRRMRWAGHVARMVERTPLDEGSVCRRDYYLRTTPPVGFESTIPAREGPQMHTLDV